MSSISSFIKEQRHIFGVCPHCEVLFRLVDIQVSYDAPYKLDWLDKLQAKSEAWETKTTELEEKEKKLRKEAIERATKTQLPKLLKRIVPTFVSSGLNPQDIKTIFHPIDFIAFDGLNGENTNRVVLMDHKTSDKEQKKVQQGILDAIKSEAVEWKTLRVDQTGSVSAD